MEADDAQLERIRSKLYDFISSNPESPDAPQARRILGKLPKVNVGGPSLLGPGSTDNTPESQPSVPTRDLNLLRGARRAERQEATAGQGLRDASGAANGILNAATFGLYGSALRHTAGVVPGASEAVSAMDEYHSAFPHLSQVTDAPGYIAGAPGQVAHAVEGMIPQAATALGRVGRAGLASGISSAITGGAEAATGGASPKEALLHAGRAGLAGLGAGAGLGAVGETVSGAARAVINSRGGKARQFIEERGGTVSPGSVDLKGDFVTDGTTDADIGQQASASARQGLHILNEQQQAERTSAGRRIGRTYNSQTAGQLRDVTDVVARMQDAAEDIGTAPETRAALLDEIKAITRKQGADFNGDTDNYFLTEGDLNRLKRSLDRFAKTGTSTHEKLVPLAQSANQVRSMVNEGPFAGPNAEYARVSRRHNFERRLLGLKENPTNADGLVDVEGGDASGEARTVEDMLKNRITRKGQNTVTAGGQRDDLATLSRRRPEVAAELDKPELLRKRADISFSLLPKQHGGLIERGGSGLGALALLEAASHAVGHGHGGVAGALGGLAGGLALQNLPAIQARLLYGPALSALATEPLLLQDIPLLAAARGAHPEER